VNDIDGFGWYMEYVGRLLKTYSQFSLEYIENELPMSFGWSLVNYAVETDGWLSFCGIRRTGKGYISQEVDKLKQQYYNSKKGEVH
jgi:hypothetical protein